MERRPHSPEPRAAAVTADAADRTQTIQSRDAKSRPGADDPGVASTQVARGTPPHLSDDNRSQLDALPIDDPDRYSLVGEHARGGLGRIVRAVDTRLRRTVAVKELLKKNDTAEALFVREALITARLQHPGIVPVIEAGRWPNGEPYYVMKLVEGRSLKELIGEARTLPDRLALLPNVIAVAEAVGYAHSQDVIHRDLKPANVVVGEFGETVVVDWGLARDGRRDLGIQVADETLARVPRSGPATGSSSAATVSGRVIGTPQYMAPEQARGETVDARADVYSTGALLYEVLAGVAPYAGGDADTILTKVVAGPPIPLADQQPDVPTDLLAIVAKAMARDPADRYPTGKELAEDLKRFQTGQLVTAQQYGTMELVRRWILRHRGPVAVAAIGAAIVLLVAIGMVRRVVDERNAARHERANAVAAQRDAEERSNAMRTLQAESSVRRDPTAAVAWLKQLPIDAANAGTAASILEESLAAGVARHVLRERDWIYGVAFSPDGARLSTASKDGYVRLYDLSRVPPAVTVLGEHPGGVAMSVFTPDGGSLVTGGSDGRVLLWPVGGGQPRTLDTLDAPVRRLDLAPGGILRVMSEGDDIAVYRVPSGETVLHVRREPRLTGLISGDMSPADPAIWVVAYLDGRLSLLDHGTLVAELPRLPRPARNLSFAPDATRVAVFDGTELSVVDVAARSRRTIGKVAGMVTFLTWSPDGTTIAVGGELQDLYLFATAATTPAEPRILRGHSDPIYMVDWSADGRRILSASDDGTAKVWDLVTGGVQTLRGHEDDVYGAAFSPDESLVATASLDGTARVWPVGATGVRVLGGDLDTIKAAKTVGDHTAVTVSSPFQVVRWDLRSGARTTLVAKSDEVYKWMAPPVSVRGDVAFSSASVTDVQLYRADGTRAALRGHRDRVSGIGFSPDGASLYSGSWDGTVRRWDVSTGTGHVVLTGDPIEALEVAPKVDRMVIVRGGVFEVHDLDGTLIGNLPKASTPRLAWTGLKLFSADGRRLVISAKQTGTNGRTIVWTPETGEVLYLEDVGCHASNLTFSPDEKQLAGAMADRTVRIWDLGTGKLVRTLEGHVDLVNRVAFAPDGRRLASASFDRTVRVWDLSTGQSRVLRGHGGSVETIAWLDDGAHLLTGSRDGTLRIWPTPSTLAATPDELRRAIDRATTAVVGAREEVATPLGS